MGHQRSYHVKRAIFPGSIVLIKNWCEKQSPMGLVCGLLLVLFPCFADDGIVHVGNKKLMGSNCCPMAIMMDVIVSSPDQQRIPRANSLALFMVLILLNA